MNSKNDDKIAEALAYIVEETRILYSLYRDKYSDDAKKIQADAQYLVEVYSEEPLPDCKDDLINKIIIIMALRGVATMAEVVSGSLPSPTSVIH